MEPTEQMMNEANKEFHPEATCRVCEGRLYLTDHGNHHAAYHCSSSSARYWDYERGTVEQKLAWDHWEKSETVI